MNSTAAGCVSERGYHGATGAFGPNRAFRACCPMASFAYFPSLESRPPEASSPQAPYPSLPPKGESSLILLRLLSPRKASRLPRGPRFRSAGLRRGPQERDPGKRGRLALTGPFRPCVPGGFWVLFAGEKYPPEGPRPRKLHIAQRVLTKSAQSRNGLSGHSSRRSLARPLPSSPQAPYPSLPPKGES